PKPGASSCTKLRNATTRSSAVGYDNDQQPSALCSCGLSEGRCSAIAADAPRSTLECSVGLLDGDDEDLGTGLEICCLSQFVNDNWRIGRHEDLRFAVLVF